MSDMDVGNSVESQSQDVAPVSQPVESHAPAQAAPEPKQERLFKQQEVADLLTRERKEAVERYKRSAQQAQSPSQQSQPHQADAMTVNPDEVRRIAAEEFQARMENSRAEAQRSAQQQEAERTATEFFTKLQTGKEKYQDFDQVMGSVKDYGKIATAVSLANMVDNTADVMYDLVKNPTKIATIQQLAAISPDLAFAEMQKMSQFIKDNEQAAKTRLPNQPLSQMRPSNTGTDNGAMGVSDYRKKYGPNYRWGR